LPLANRIADIVDPEQCFGDFGASPAEQLRRLAQLARIHLDEVNEVEQRPHSLILNVRCRGRAETVRFRYLPADWFPPSVFIAYLNAKLADAGSDDRLVACNDAAEETVALCTPAQARELRAAIFARIDDLRWPPAVRTPIELELLDAIRNTPDDNGPRLVYADWLIERDDPRGHFIMLQCHAEREMRDRASPLLALHEPTWTCHLPAWARDPQFSRGFVEHVRNAEGMRVRLTGDGQLDALAGS
jgi:uncharacterized protein (TIGR02996 family)